MLQILLHSIILLVFVVLLSLLLIYVRSVISPLRHIPGRPLTRPLFGTFIEYVHLNQGMLELGVKDKKKYGILRTVFMFFGRRRVIVSDPYCIKQILTTNSKNYSRGDFAGMENVFFAVGENGLIVIAGELHKRIRKLASPAFKLSQLKKVMPIIEMCGKRMVQLFRTRCQENNENITEICVKEILNKTTLDIIGLMSFGHDFKDACTFDKDTFGHYLREWMDEGLQLTLCSILPFQMIMKRFMIELSLYLPMCLQIVSPFRLAQTTYRIHDLVENLVRDKIKEKRDEALNIEISERNRNNSKTLLDFILDASDTFDVCQKELHDILMTFLIAGHETTTLSVTWTLYLLAKNPLQQNKCRVEANEFFACHNESVDWDDVHKLTYMNAVVHESLRLYPSVPWVPRCSLSPTEMSGYHIPSGTEFLLSIGEIQRSDEYWSNPEDFIPERFLEPHDSIPWEAYMPFGDGVHKCIGYQLASTETMYLVAVLLHNFEFSIDPAIHYHEFAVITLNPKPDMKLYFKVL